MSERLRQAYLKQWEAELRKRVQRKNAAHMAKQHLAGEKFKEQHPWLFKEYGDEQRDI